ncbi:type VII secretion protein EccB [Asanoa siamensis]|uniref:Type VII secretion protein EccB n=1 Tax=Asanoa siamensis TaxID=926357 RepID=A0ABQ4CR68_9ACTN|nr:type VII secretion protein EccB [Asanoa siamensis]GIF73775.1 type VII secretion protein EccB [Asanoa siamensis]
MRSRREQLQAYRFLIRRIVSASLAGEPETNELPMRRYGLAVVGGIAVAVLLLAGVGVYGLLRPGGSRPVENAIIVERETGAKFIYTEGLLHPVLNWTSAVLVLGQPRPAVRTLSQSSLRTVPRGLPIGIADAPDTLPGKASLIGLPVSVCSARRAATSVDRATHLLVGRAPTGGAAVGDGGLLVTAGDDQRYLLWSDHRLRIRDNGVLAALGWAGIQPVSVGETFLNSVPPGPDLAPLAVEGAGQRAGARIRGELTLVGQLFRAADQHYVMLADGLAPVGAVTATLLRASGRAVNEISAQEAGAVLVATPAEPPGFPGAVPTVRGTESPSAMVCAIYRDAAAATAITVETFGATPPEVPPLDAQATAVGGTDGVRAADRVAVPGGQAALVRAANQPGAVYLITDQGVKFPLPGADAAQVQASLGYAGVTPTPVPADLLALVPTGVALDPRAAARLSPPPTVAPAPTPGN